jgi:type IV secretory pathway TrbF-like protein
MFFKRPSIRYGKTPEPETPYQRAAQVWDDRIGSARVQARNWRLMAFGSLFLSAGLGAGLVWVTASGTVVPWVVQVDRLGQAQAVAPADAEYRPTDPQIAWHLARFTEQTRAIPADPIVLRQNWLRAYDYTTDRGAAALNDYARTNDPFALLGKEPSRSPPSFAPHPTASGSPGSSAATSTARSPSPSAGPRSSPSPSRPRATRSASGATRSASTSTPSTGPGS